jgi:glycerophosphoryl diester phosphodiesterase
MGNIQDKDIIEEKKSSLKIIAHRGSSKYFEDNSLDSLKQAIKEGIKDIEIDVVITLDNQIILNHDIIKDHMDNLISEKEYNNELLLTTVFSELPKDINYIIDLKDPRPNSNLVVELLKICNQFHNINNCIFSSFNMFHLLELCKYELETGHILKKGYATNNLDLDFYKEKIIMFKLSHLILYKFQITPDIISLIKKNNPNIKIFVYTCNTKNLFNYCLRCNVDGLFSDNPNKFIRRQNYYILKNPPEVKIYRRHIYV